MLVDNVGIAIKNHAPVKCNGRTPIEPFATFSNKQVQRSRQKLAVYITSASCFALFCCGFQVQKLHASLVTVNEPVHISTCFYNLAAQRCRNIIICSMKYESKKSHQPLYSKQLSKVIASHKATGYQPPQKKTETD